MKILYIILTLLFHSKTLELAQIQAFEFFEDDKNLYVELLHDQEKERFLKVFLNTAHGDLISLTDDQWAELDWANAQKERAFPVLLEVLKREKDIDYTARAGPWKGIIRKEALLGFIKKKSTRRSQGFLAGSSAAVTAMDIARAEICQS